MRVEEIKAAIEGLPGPEFLEIRKWGAEKDWQMWNQELEADSRFFYKRGPPAPLSISRRWANSGRRGLVLTTGLLRSRTDLISSGYGSAPTMNTKG